MKYEHIEPYLEIWKNILCAYQLFMTDSDWILKSGHNGEKIVDGVHECIHLMFQGIN